MIATSLLLLAALAQQSPDSLQNGSFETAGDPPPHWSVSIGANNGGTEPESRVEITRENAHAGESCLAFAGDVSTRAWRFVHQDVAIEPGDRVTLRFWVRTAGITREGNQFANAYGAIFFQSLSGKLLQREVSPTFFGDREWTPILLRQIAPPAASTARIAFFSSMSGSMWIDDVVVEKHATTPFEARVADEAFAATTDHLLRTYPFFGIGDKPKDPVKWFAKWRKKCTQAADSDQFASRLGEMLAELEDLHVWIATPRAPIYTVRGNPHPSNWNFAAVDAALQSRVAEDPSWAVGELGNGVGYARLNSLTLDATAFARFEAALDGLANAKALILDVRANGGGDESIAQRLAGRFASAPTPYAESRYRDPLAPDDPTKFIAPATRSLSPRDDREPDQRPVFVLQGPYCVSSTEGFLLMCKALPTVTTVGRRSRGASAKPMAFGVLAGYTLYASTWRSSAPGGACIETVGIPPDVEVDAPATAYRKSDPTLERAVELARAALRPR